MRDSTNPRDSWSDRLSDYLDGELSPWQRRALLRHLAECTACTRALDELRQVAAQARSWQASAEPERDLWPGIATRLEPRPSRWRMPRLAVGPGWLVPGLGAAAALLVALVAWTVLAPRQRPAVAHRAPVVSPSVVGTPAAHDRDYERTVAGLQREAASRLRLDPHVLEVLDENLATLDAAIACYRDALAGDPGDARLRTRLDEARQRKLDVLRQAVTLSAEGSE